MFESSSAAEEALPQGWWPALPSEDFLAWFDEAVDADDVRVGAGPSPVSAAWSVELFVAERERAHDLPRMAVGDIDLPQVGALTDALGTADAVSVIAALTDLDASSLVQDYAVVELIAGLQRARTWIEAREADALLTFARRPMLTTRRRLPATMVESSAFPGHDAADQDVPPVLLGDPGDVTRNFVAEELAPRLGVSPRTITERLSLATSLANLFPEAMARHRSGLLDSRKARVLVHEAVALEPQECVRLEERVLDRSAEQSPTQFARSVRRQIAAMDPAATVERHKRGCQERHVRIDAAPDGMAWLTAFLPAQDAVLIHEALTAAATRAKADDSAERRTLDQLRADLLTWPFEAALRTGVLTGPTDQQLSRPRHARPHIQVSAPLTMLLGLTEEPAELRGYGPIPAPVARRIAAEGTWRRLLTDPPSGAVLDVGTSTYAPPADLTRHVEARDRSCRFPGCSRPAFSSDLDHVVPFPHGPTADHNLAVLCRRHHRFKHHDPDRDDARPGPDPAIHVEQPAPGTLRWRLPSGHEYIVEPSADD